LRLKEPRLKGAALVDLEQWAVDLEKSAFQRTAFPEEKLVDWTQGASRLKESAFQGPRLTKSRSTSPRLATSPRLMNPRFTSPRLTRKS